MTTAAIREQLRERYAAALASKQVAVEATDAVTSLLQVHAGRRAREARRKPA